VNGFLSKNLMPTAADKTELWNSVLKICSHQHTGYKLCTRIFSSNDGCRVEYQ
jgi:hypothetical protein